MSSSFYMPVKMLIGNDIILENKDLFKSFGKNALIVTGKNSAKLSGALDDVLNVLNQNDIKYSIFDKIMPNPTVDVVYLGACNAKENNSDFIIAIGGGSVMDAAKVISSLALSDIKKDDVFNNSLHNKTMPMIFIPTTAGTGSEVTPYAILTDDANETKTSISNPSFYPKVAFIDGKYTNKLSKNITVNTALDALSHAIESLLSKRCTDISSLYANEAIRLIGKELDNLINFNLNQDSRNNLLYASSLAGIAISMTSTVIVHVMGYPLTYFKNIDHGRANGLLLAEFLKQVNKTYDYMVNNILKLLKLDNLLVFEEKMDKLLGEKEKITKEEILKYSNNSLKKKNVKNTIIDISLDDIKEMYYNVFMR